MENEIYMEEQILEADKLYGDGEYAECKRRLLDMLEQEPAFGRAHHLIGCLYFYILDDHEKAYRHMKLAVKFAPNYPAGFVNYARLLNYLNRHREVLMLIPQALSVEGVNKCVMLMELGKSFEQNGNYTEALNCYYEAERYAIHYQETEAVVIGIKRLKKKQLRPLRKFFGL